MDSPEEIMKLLREKSELQHEKHKRAEMEQEIEHRKVLEELKKLRDERTQMKESLNKNLKTLTAQKQAIQKIAKDSGETRNLPVTHQYQQKTISVVSDVITLINNLSAICEPQQPEKTIDIVKICDDIKAESELANDEINRAKACLEQVETLRQNAGIIKEHHLSSDDVEPDMNNSIIFKVESNAI